MRGYVAAICAVYTRSGGDSLAGYALDAGEFGYEVVVTLKVRLCFRFGCWGASPHVSLAFIEWPFDTREHSERQVEAQGDVDCERGAISDELSPQRQHKEHDRQSGHQARSKTAGLITIGLRSTSSHCNG